MDTREYHKQYGRAGLDALAKRMGTSSAYLSQLAHGHRQASWRFAQRLEAATDGEITCRDERPDIFDASLSA